MDVSYPIMRLTSDVDRPFKIKHVRYLVASSHDTSCSMSSIFKCIAFSLREPNWIVVIKSLSLVHLLLREGQTARLLGFLAGNIEILDLRYFRDASQHPMGNSQAPFIKAYALFLEEKVLCFRITKTDWITQRGEMSALLRTLKGEPLIKHSELLLKMMEVCNAVNWSREDLDVSVIQQAYRMLIADMMGLFQLMNEAIIGILGVYFTLNRENARAALNVYKRFCVETKKSVASFDIATKMRELQMDIPKFTSPPTSLANNLEAYLEAPDFEEKRNAYKNKDKSPSARNLEVSPTKMSIIDQNLSKMAQSNPKSREEPLIDFFNSIENHVSVFQNANQSSNDQTFNLTWDDNFGKQAQNNSMGFNASNNRDFPSNQQVPNQFESSTQQGFGPFHQNNQQVFGNVGFDQSGFHQQQTYNQNFAPARTIGVTNSQVNYQVAMENSAFNPFAVAKPQPSAQSGYQQLQKQPTQQVAIPVNAFGSLFDGSNIVVAPSRYESTPFNPFDSIPRAQQQPLFSIQGLNQQQQSIQGFKQQQQNVGYVGILPQQQIQRLSNNQPQITAQGQIQQPVAYNPFA